MTEKKFNLGAGFDRRRFLQTAGAGIAAAALPTVAASVARADDTVNLTCWAWTPGTQDVVNMFQQKYPNIKVNLQNVGQGGPHYVKLRDAIKAGTGLPDVGQMEFNSIPSFKALQALADMGQNGANDIKDRFVDWTWKAASDGDKVYGIPWDSGPMGLLYREDVFSDNKLTVPTTWDDFAEQGLALAKNKPGSFITNLGVSDAGWVAAVLWQKGWRPFHVDGTNIHIQLNDSIAKDWAAYWQKLVDAKAVSTKPLWTTDWFADFDSGNCASWITAAWGPTLMAASMKNSAGKWRATGMPQWTADGKVDSNWGGSTLASFTTSQHPKEAAMLAMFVCGDPTSARYWNQKQYLFPTQKALIADPALMGTKYDFYGGQAVNEVFAKGEGEVDVGFEFAPFQDAVNAQLQDEIAASLGGKGSLADAFDRTQDSVVAYATDQGFTVV
jgi:multiple sugar transport system substrate-binding protein